MLRWNEVIRDPHGGREMPELGFSGRAQQVTNLHLGYHVGWPNEFAFSIVCDHVRDSQPMAVKIFTKGKANKIGPVPNMISYMD